MNRFPLPALLGAGLGVAAVLLAPGGARAHGIESNLERLGGLSAGLDFSRTASGQRAPSARLQLESHFSNGLPAREASVRLVPPSGGKAIELGRTDERGQLTFALPAQAADDWEIQVDAGPGHRDYLELPGSRPPAAGPAATLQRRLGRIASRTAPLAPVAVFGLIGGLGLLQRRRRS